MSGKVATCKNCGTELGARNRSGFCRRHFSPVAHSGGTHGAKISAGIKRRLQADPEFAEALRARAAHAARSPATVKARTERWNRDKPWIAGNRASSAPEVRAKAAATCSATRLSWCPPHLRKSYLQLVKTKGVNAADARAMIEDQEAAEMARWRRRHLQPGVFVL